MLVINKPIDGTLFCKNTMFSYEMTDTTFETNICLMHIPPNTTPFNNRYTIHLLQLDRFSMSVPKPLCLIYAWIRYNHTNTNTNTDQQLSRVALQNCVKYLFQTKINQTNLNNKKPFVLFQAFCTQNRRVKGKQHRVFPFFFVCFFLSVLYFDVSKQT